MRIFALIALFPLLVGCGGSQSGGAEGALRYTIRDANGIRASGNRDSVLKTVGMTEPQIKEWANDHGFRTSQDRASAVKTLEMSLDQIKAWAEDESAAHERRSASFARNGYMEMISRGTMEEPPGLWR